VAGWDAVEAPALRAFRAALDAPGSKDGLAPIFMRRERQADGSTRVLHVPGTVLLGARGDSYYEYMLKQYIASSKQDDALLRHYVAAMGGVRDWLLGETAPPAAGGLMYVGEMHSRNVGNELLLGKLRTLAPSDRSRLLDPKVDHLTCFLPGVLALGHFHGVETGAPCPCPLAQTYEVRPSALAGVVQTQTARHPPCNLPLRSKPTQHASQKLHHSC
jgi:Glycosyl hydrolase family 47